jgi:ferric-dicitrate binding protein FerR (iron transport regulator)
VIGLSRLAIYSKTKLMPEKKINHRIEELVLKWRSGQLTAPEKAELDQWYSGFDDSLLIEDSTVSIDDLRERIYLSILEKTVIETSTASSYPDAIPLELTDHPRTRLWPRLAAAAAIIIVLSGAVCLLIRRFPTPEIAKTPVHDVAPGGNKAILTLANGSHIALDSAQKGLLTQQQDAVIEKTADGSIRYATANGISASPAGAPQYNIISTPRGGQYAVTLSDGTRVMLNAASSLRYPAVFTGKDRHVELSGEAWFDIARDKQHPFIVTSGDQDIQVLGTQFNLNAYDDEPGIKTTLLTGSVIVSNRSTHRSHSLSPGQQSLLTATNLSISTADTEEATAWKNGYFMFESKDIASIMRTVARWYDVDVKFDGPQPTDKFNGTVQRLVNVSQVLRKLELTNKVHFNIEGRTIMVSK